MKKTILTSFVGLAAALTGCAVSAPGETGFDDSVADVGTQEEIGETEAALSANTKLPLFGLERYGVVAFGNVTELTHVDDTMAVQGNLSLGSTLSTDGYVVYQYAETLTDSALVIDPSITVGGNVTLGVGTVKGTSRVLYGGTAKVNTNSATAVLTKHPMQSANFKAYKVAADLIASRFKGQAATAPVVTNNTGKVTYTFTGTAALNVFQLDASVLNDVADVNNVVFNVPAGATVVVNVAGTSVNANRIDFSGTDFGKVLWNFHDATSLSINTIKFQGTVLAPAAALSFGNGRIEGSVIVGSIPGDGDKTGGIYHNPFTGNLAYDPGKCAFDFYQATTKSNVDATFDGANCYIRSVKSVADFNGWGGLVYTKGTDVYSQRKYCLAGGYDGANCFVSAVPAGTKAFLYANNFYYTAKSGAVKCDAPASYDGANCYIGPVPAGATPFIYNNAHYVAPTGGCSVGVDEGNRCYIGTTPDGTTPFVYGGNLYYQE